MRRVWVENVTIRAVLVVGFGVTIALWAFSAFSMSRRVSELEAGSVVTSDRYMDAQERLSTARADLLLASIYVRDALLDPSTAAAEASAGMHDNLVLIEEALDEYVPIIGSAEERERIALLRHDVGVFRATLSDVLASGPSLSPQQRVSLLQHRLTPQRQSTIVSAERALASNRAAFVREQQTMSRVYGTMQRRLAQALGLTLAASLVIGLFTAMYAGRLEGRLRDQRKRDALLTDDLQQLAAELLDVQERERRAIARELHDEIGQALLAIKVEATVAGRELDASGVSPKILADLEALADGALTTVRDLSRLLHPVVLDDLGLAAAVDAYLNGFSKRYGVQAELIRDDVDVRVDGHIEAAAYRIIQEALTNVARHAEARTCHVRLQYRSERLRIAVEDDGVGFVPDNSAARRRGLGLIGIRERVSHLGGTLSIVTAPGKGTRLLVELPFRRHSAVMEVESTGEGAVRGVGACSA